MYNKKKAFDVCLPWLSLFIIFVYIYNVFFITFFELGEGKGMVVEQG